MTSWPAYCATLIIVAALAFANLDGYHNHLFGDGNFDGEPPLINWAHGWPCCFLIRKSPWDASDPAPRPDLQMEGNYIYSRWPFDRAPVFRYWLRPLLIDVAVAIMLIVGTFWSSQRLASKLRINPQFGLKTLFGITAAIGAFFAFGLPLVQSIAMRRVFHFLTLAVLAVAVAAIVAVACEAALRGLWRLALRFRQ